MKTAEELCRIEYEDYRPEHIFMERSCEMKWCIFMMKRFAEKHVKEALKIAKYQADTKELSSYDINEMYRKKIEDCYPLTKIK